MNYKEKYNLWLEKVKDEQLLNELKSMTEEQISNAFFKDMTFGTAGLRGTIGAGSNCMNKYNVCRVTKAICEYLKKNNGKSVAVSYDSRNMSQEFAQMVAGVCAENGIKVHLSNDMMPTPFLSYMVRYYGCDMGVMITASHNPKDYNGYKAYSSDGCQLLDEPSEEITKIAETLDLFDTKMMNYDEAVSKGFVKLTDDKILTDYINDVKLQAFNKIENLKVAFTALNGTGVNTIPRTLAEQGAEVVLNSVQCKPDKNFTTCPYPNPEKLEVYESTVKLAKQVDADIIIASDPDADRVGVRAKHNGEYVHLNGNEIGILLTDYLFSKANIDGGWLVKSIVSASLAEKIAKKYGGKVKNTLTGFRYIGSFITDLESQGNENQFVLGFEESYGYLIGTHVRDKDATVASLLLSELASELKKQGKTLVDRLEELFAEFGAFYNEVLVFRYEGESGSHKMQEIMKNLRTNTTTEIGGYKVVEYFDYLEGVDDLPKSDVLIYNLENDGQVIVRTSGTEPLIKAYVALTKTKDQNKKDIKQIKADVEKVLS